MLVRRALFDLSESLGTLGDESHRGVCLGEKNQILFRQDNPEGLWVPALRLSL